MHGVECRMFGPRVEVRAEVKFDRTIVVLLISRFSTNLCDQFSKIGRYVMSSLLDFFFFFFFFKICVHC
jgi:hypothetical protein